MYELAVKWSTIGAFVPQNGAEIGMTALSSDADEGVSGAGRQIM